MNDTQEIYELEIRIKVKGTTKEELEKEIIKFKDAGIIDEKRCEELLKQNEKVIELKQYEKKVEELKQELKNMNVKTHSGFNVDNLSNFS